MKVVADICTSVYPGLDRALPTRWNSPVCPTSIWILDIGLERFRLSTQASILNLLHLPRDVIHHHILTRAPFYQP